MVAAGIEALQVQGTGHGGKRTGGIGDGVAGGCQAAGCRPAHEVRRENGVEPGLDLAERRCRCFVRPGQFHVHPPDQETQAADAEIDVEIAQEQHIGRRCTGFADGALRFVDAAGVEVAPKAGPHRADLLPAQIGDPFGQPLGHHGEFQPAIGAIGKARRFRRLAVHAAAPGCQSFQAGREQQQAHADGGIDGDIHLRHHADHDMAQPARPGRNRLDRAQAVADRLLPRNIGEGAQDGAEKAGRLAGHRAIVVHPRLGIEIDKAPVHLAMRRAFAQGGQRRAKGPVVEHGAIDQVDAFRVRAAGQHPIDEGLPPRPVFAAAGQQRVDLGNPCRREGAGKARRGPRRKHQIRRRPQMPLSAVTVAGKADHQPVLGFGHFFRRVQSQALGAP